MSLHTARRFAPAVLAILFAVSILAFASLRGGAARAEAKPAPAGNILIAWGVGGVLTDDGTLWQYRPESRKWVTVDQSFSLDGERRKVLPLPVAPQDIVQMQGFGFLVTKSGTCWIYNLDENRWERIGAPGA
jgi:hypothetical protein